MIRVWIGLALLAGSLLFGMGYYHEPDIITWSLCVVGGTILVGGMFRPIAKLHALIAAALLIPPLLVAPWPYKAAPPSST